MEGGDKSGTESTGLFGRKDQFNESKIYKFWMEERPVFEDMQLVSKKVAFGEMEGGSTNLGFGEIESESKIEGGDRSGTESTGLFGPKDQFKESKIYKFWMKERPVFEDMQLVSKKVEFGEMEVIAVGGPLFSLHSNRPGPSYKPHLFFRAPQAAEALKFYRASFGAQVMSIVKNPERKADQEAPLIETAEFKIGSDIFSLSDIEDESFLTSGFVSMMTDDIDGVVEKAMKAGAVKGKMIRVYSACCAWCSVIKLIDPYGHIWMIYSKMCQPCLKSIVLLT